MIRPITLKYDACVQQALRAVGIWTVDSGNEGDDKQPLSSLFITFDPGCPAEIRHVFVAKYYLLFIYLCECVCVCANCKISIQEKHVFLSSH